MSDLVSMPRSSPTAASWTTFAPSGTSDVLTVYDLRDPARPRRAGHFAAPEKLIKAAAPLPGGRIILGGRELLVLPPPRGAAPR